MPAFVLNDENTINSYGFRVLNSGIDLIRFKQNPVMLNDHWNNTYYVLGSWLNLRVEGSKLIAEPNFDLDDKQAKEIAGKVERGFIKGCSMGILFDRDKMEWEGAGKFKLTSCELLEASIVAVPSNASAISLYAKDSRKLMSEEEVKLCLSAIPDSNFSPKNDNNNMKKIILSQVALIALSLLDHNSSDGVDATLVEKAIGQMSADLKKAKADLSNTQTALEKATGTLTELQNEAKAKQKLDAEAAIQLAVTEGRIDATAKEEWVTLMISNPEMAKKTLAAIPAKKSLSGQVNNPSPGSPSPITEQEFEALSEEAQLEFKTNNPEGYKKLFA
jgi:HK97 family phage prohead protease